MRRRKRTRYEEAGSEGPPPTAVAPPPAREAQPGPAALPPPSAPPAAPVPAPVPAPAATPTAPEPEAAAPAAEPTPSDAMEAPKRRRRLRGIAFVVGLAFAAFVTGVLVFNSLVMPRLIHGIGEVRVPDVRNLTLDQAEQALVPLDLQLSRAGERFDPAVPRGFVLSQDPQAGTAVRGRRRVSVVVSLGEEFSSVPELFGESQRSAEQLLRSAGLRLGSITRAPSDEVGADLVAGSDPGPESVLPQGSAVSLLISTGSGAVSFVMPDVIGREIGGVRRQLEAMGFEVVVPFGAPSIGTIVYQRPPAGSRIAPNVQVALQATGRLIR